MRFSLNLSFKGVWVRLPHALQGEKTITKINNLKKKGYGKDKNDTTNYWKW